MTDVGAPFAGRRVDKPWGYELIWAETPRYVGKILHIERGQSAELPVPRTQGRDDVRAQRDPGARGRAAPTGARQTLRLRPGQSFHISPGLRHRMTAVETCDVLEASTPELEDVVRLEDRYGRVGK